MTLAAQVYYSASTHGFYNSEINKNIPDDAVLITDDMYQSLMIDQEQGNLIVPSDNGMPTSQTQQAPTEEKILQIRTQMRMAAYQAEADPLFFKWQREESTKQEWLDKVEEIKNRY